MDQRGVFCGQCGTKMLSTDRLCPNCGAPREVAASAPPAVTTHVAGPTMIFTHQNTGPGCLIRALWYVFIGWWASAFAIVLGYLALITLIGIPLAFYIFNRIPTILTLRPRTQDWSVETGGGVTHVRVRGIAQRPWWARALYFLAIGWWFGAVWLVLAWIFSALIITLPIAFLMYNRISGVMTLQRH